MQTSTVLETVLLICVGILSALNTYWAKSWKDHTDKIVELLIDKVTKVSERIARIEGHLGIDGDFKEPK